MDQFECNRCHQHPKLAAPSPAKDCVGCHLSIHAGTFEAEPEVLALWKTNIHNLVASPSLAATGRLRRAWVRSHLLRPVDARPHLGATMPKLPLSAEQADTLAAALVPVEAPKREFSPGLVPGGRALFGDLGCAACHRFSGLDGAGLPAPDAHARALAPDLRLARERMQSGKIVSWLSNPQSRDPETLMPNFGLKKSDAEALAAFVMLAPIAPSAPPRPLPALNLLQREVRYDEVEARVFRKICWHCHATADFALGDGGPGNTGGFGFSPRGLDLSSYAGSQSGSLDNSGQRQSVFREGDDGFPLIVSALLARHAEVRGEVGTALRGMPLGFPPLPIEDIELVATWIEQGRGR